MARFIFVTKTRWEEPPRLRHQLAHLLADAGHEVVFFERPLAPWQSRRSPRDVAPRIVVAQYAELVHHKLRLARWLHALNAVPVRSSLSAAVRDAGGSQDAVLVNFNYDYWFLRDVFPANRLVTIINDDFVATAPFGARAPLEWALARTCRASDAVLTVSLPLQRQLERYRPVDLFLPWADRAYVAPARSGRDTLLFWGFVNRKIDFPLVHRMAASLARAEPDIRIVFAGPVEQGTEGELAALKRHPNVDVQGATPIDRLPLERTCCAIIPYRSGSGDIDAIMLPNKALQLLARGIPIAITGMPHFIAAPFVFRMRDGTDAPALVRDIRARFDMLQPGIRSFVEENGAPARLTQFMDVCFPEKHAMLAGR